MEKIDIAVVGASGMVGGELLGLLEQRSFPVGQLFPFSSGKRDSFIKFKGESIKCHAPSIEELKKARLVFFVSMDEVSAAFARKLAEAGSICIDDSSYYRLAEDVPLCIPEVNGASLKNFFKGKNKGNKRGMLIAGPNCTITGAAVSLAEIHRKYGIRELRISSYQAVCGAGRDAMLQMEKEVKHYASTGEFPKEKGVFPRPIAFNLFPQVGGFDSEGFCSEERKVSAELKKILNAPSMKVSSTTVRVPVLRGHSLAIWAATEKTWTIADLECSLEKTPGLKFFRKPEEYPSPLEYGTRTDIVYAGRLRAAETGKNEFQLWTVSDNLYKGAALNSVQIAEYLADNGLL